MAVVAIIVLADLEARFGAARVRQYLDDDGDGVADATVVTEVLADANGDVVSRLLRKGHSEAEIELLKGDPWVKRRACEIAIAYASERKPEWLNANGEGPFEAVRKRARADLKEWQMNEARIPTETDIAKRKNVGGDLARGPGFVFAESDDNPTGSGGF